MLRRISRENDQRSFEKLFQLYFSKLYRFAYTFLKDREVAEEVIEDVFVKVWQNRRKLIAIKDINLYLYAAVKNQCLNKIKQNKSRQNLNRFFPKEQVDLIDPEKKLLIDELKAEIRDAVDLLPPKCKMTFKLLKEEHISYKDAAVLLGVSPKTIEAQMNTAIRKIGHALKGHLILKDNKLIILE